MVPSTINDIGYQVKTKQHGGYTERHNEFNGHKVAPKEILEDEFLQLSNTYLTSTLQYPEEGNIIEMFLISNYLNSIISDRKYERQLLKLLHHYREKMLVSNDR